MKAQNVDEVFNDIKFKVYINKPQSIEFLYNPMIPKAEYTRVFQVTLLAK